ncbi:MAG: hypothetical protein H6658_02670 [Ardenticatenaceae bacterium]|nr:hypothetical protein [Ardenticatenaceae bacterium]
MNKSRFLMLCVFVLVLVIACGPAPDAATTVPDRTETEGEGDVFPRPTITPVPEGEGESVTEPEATAVPEEYPAKPEPVTQPESAYPAGEAIAQPESAYPAEGETVWMVFPVGVQCEEGSGEYADLDEAVAALDTAGVVVVDQGTVELIVAAACGQPTSEHFRVEVLADGLEQAQGLGWEVYEE